LLDRLSVLFVRHLFFLLFFVLKALRREIRVLVPEMPHDPRWKAALDLAVKGDGLQTLLVGIGRLHFLKGLARFITFRNLHLVDG